TGACGARDGGAERTGTYSQRPRAPRPDPSGAPTHAATNRNRILSQTGIWLKETFRERCWIAVELLFDQAHQERLDELQNLGKTCSLPLVAAGDVHMHRRGRRALQDTLTAVREGKPLTEVGNALFSNGERHLRRRETLATIYPAPLLAETVTIARACRFRLSELNYTYPRELVPAGLTPASHLRRLTYRGMRERWPEGAPADVRRQIEHELTLIEELRYEPYFLTVQDVVAYARREGILCQGRGSAANSAVCFCLGITEVDPARMSMLFERFISKERNEPPDIDVDFEHQRREEVIQYVYRKYGRDRAALAATVVTYRPRSALRDVGKALGFDAEQIDRLARSITYWDSLDALSERLAETGFDPSSPAIIQLMTLVGELIGFPRHLSQHVGGFVISEHPLAQLVPVENAAMVDRTIIQWDKDDLEALGLLKVDCLALGMLSAIRRCLDLVSDWRGRRLTLADIPPEDPDVYGMIQQADTVGVFQIESRAQMSMLPRLKPACFYDLVIEVAIVRPGPIQGKMVHPYLRRRQGKEPVTYPSEGLRKVFERTLGVPIFQEQVMQLAIVAAGFSAGEADQLRRSMAAWKRHGGLDHFERRIVEGMRQRGYDEAFARRVFEQIKGFGSYGFPESHAASFALLVYVSCWLKHHEPAAFCCALLNSQPMGFYAPSQLIQDVRRHDVEVLPVDVLASHWDSTLEGDPGHPHNPQAAPRLRLGLRQCKGFPEDAAERLLAARRARPFRDVQDLVTRAQLDRRQQRTLADAGALASLSGNRHQAYWDIAGVEHFPEVLKGSHIDEPAAQLRPPSEVEDMLADYSSQGFSLGRHPVALLRPALSQARVRTIEQVRHTPSDTRLRAGGLVTLRQRPGTASGVTFLTLEDDTGMLNVIVWRDLAEAQRRVLLGATLMVVDGVLECQEGVWHLIAEHLHSFDHLLDDLKIRARNFC
ncbi:MAG: error-prone DNA polymerase, partial [Pseudomonadota bacterium]